MKSQLNDSSLIIFGSISGTICVIRCNITKFFILSIHEQHANKTTIQFLTECTFFLFCSHPIPCIVSLSWNITVKNKNISIHKDFNLAPNNWQHLQHNMIIFTCYMLNNINTRDKSFQQETLSKVQHCTLDLQHLINLGFHRLHTTIHVYIIIFIKKGEQSISRHLSVL